MVPARLRNDILFSTVKDQANILFRRANSNRHNLSHRNDQFPYHMHFYREIDHASIREVMQLGNRSLSGPCTGRDRTSAIERERGAPSSLVTCEIEKESPQH
jgi:hypothetical protein